MRDKLPTISISEIRVPTTGEAVILAEEGGALSATGKALDKAADGAITRAIELNEFTGKPKTSLDLLVPQGTGLDRLFVIGAGNLAEYSQNDWLMLGGAIRGRLFASRAKSATVVLEAADERAKLGPEAAANLAAGMLLRSYTFLKYKTKKRDDGNGENGASDEGPDKPDGLEKVALLCAGPGAARTAFAKARAVAEGVNLARDLVNEPANVLDPSEFAKRVKALSKTGLKVTILDEKALKKEKMGALLSVGQGSAKPSFVAVMEWQGAGERGGAPVAIVGKGVCFDSGGISIKPAAGMEDMKGDMAGAACVAGLMKALATRKAKVNAVGLIGLVENMPSGTATRPGDIVRSMSGQTIEVINTDAEGRLVLADVLWYAQQKFKPKWIVNLATLTGAILVALGKEHAGLFANDDDLANKLAAAGEATDEKVWRLPLGQKYDELLKSKSADMKNVGGRYGGSITAAQFLQRFIKKGTPWAHLDIAGTAMGASQTLINPSWGPGFGVRLLDRLIADAEEK